MPPPAEPIDVDPAMLQRNLISLKLTSGLPEDYLRYSMLYGSGVVEFYDTHPDWRTYGWDICSPARLSYPVNVASFFDVNNQYREAMETFYIPLGLYPEPGGLLPFGVDGGGTWLTWKTDGTPDKWNVVIIYSYDDDEYSMLDMNFTEFLYHLLKREISVRNLNTDQFREDKGTHFSQKIYYW